MLKEFFFLFLVISEVFGCIFNPKIHPLVQNQCCEFNQIEVSGEGSVSGQPDISIIRVRFQAKKPTAEEAIQHINQRVSKLVSILQANSIIETDFEVNSISVFNDFQDGKVVGKRASQSITITIRNLDSEGKRVGSLIDQIAQVEDLLIDGVSFDIFDKSPLQEQARKQAFKAAEQKAKDYADAAGMSVGRVITIIDGQFDQTPPIQFDDRLASNVGQTQVPVGEMEVSYRNTVTFRLEYPY